MADIFSQQGATNVKAYKLGKTLIRIPGSDSLVCRSAMFRYTQQVSTLTPLNADTKYLIIGEASGEGTLDLVLGPSKNVKAFIEKFSKACQDTKDNVITLESNSSCNGEEKNTFTLRGVLITQVSSQIQRGQGGVDLFPATVQFMFNSLELS